MISDEYPDDCVTPTVPAGARVDAFEEEDEGPDTSIGYGSLLSLGSSMRKKQPLIVVDPLEAENEARRVQFVAAQRFVAADESEALDFLKGLTIPAADTQMEEGQQELASTATEKQADFVADDCVIAAETSDGEAGAEPSREADAVVLPEVAFAIEATPVAEPGNIYAIVIAEAEPEPPLEPVAEAAFEAELMVCEPVPAPVDPAPQGHSLRARLPTHAPRRTLADHAAALFRWLVARLRPRRA